MSETNEAETVEPLAITVEDAAARLHIGRALAYAMAKDGTLPTVRAGKKRLMVPLARLNRMLDEGD